MTNHSNKYLSSSDSLKKSVSRSKVKNDPKNLEEAKKQTNDRRPESASRKPMRITNPIQKDPKYEQDLNFQLRDENEKMKKHQIQMNEVIKK